jgi:hypothetical protein
VGSRRERCGSGVPVVQRSIHTLQVGTTSIYRCARHGGQQGATVWTAYDASCGT